MGTRKPATTSGKKTVRKVVVKKSAATKVLTPKRKTATSKTAVRAKKVISRSEKAKHPTKARTISSVIGPRNVKKTLDLRERKNSARIVPLEKIKSSESYATVDRKLNSAAAIAFVAVLSLVIGTLVFLNSKKDERLASEISAETLTVNANNGTSQNAVDKPVEIGSVETGATSGNCEVHKYDGEAKIHGWYASGQENQNGGVLVAVSKEDLEKLPINIAVLGDRKDNFVIKVVDAQNGLLANIEKATKEKPLEFTIKGYMATCEEPHLSSIEPASVAFKKI